MVTETQAEALRFRQELEHQAQEVLASATQAVSHAEARSRETEALARQEARELQAQLGGARNALGESHDQTRMLQAQLQQLQDEKSQLAARLERIESLLASRTRSHRLQRLDSHNRKRLRVRTIPKWHSLQTK